MYDSWISFVYVCFMMGLMLNLLILFLFIKYRKNEEGLAKIEIFQTCIDIAVCLWFLVSFSDSTGEIKDKIFGIFYCHVLKTSILTWLLMSVRLNINFLIATYCFIKLIYPFIRIESKKSINVAVIITLLCSGLISTVPHIFESSFDNEQKKCIHNHTILFSKHRKLGIFLRLMIMFNVIHNFIIPLFGSFYFYGHIFSALKASGNEKTSRVYQELSRNHFCNTWLFLFTSSTGYVQCLLGRYVDLINFENDTLNYRITMIIMKSYCILYPLISILIRRNYQKPFEELFQDTGLPNLCLFPRRILRCHKHTGNDEM